MSSTRVYAALLILGAGILLFRTVALLAGGAHRVLKPWVVGLTLLEMAIDAMTIAGAGRWWLSSRGEQSHLALRAGAAATFLHAFRVLVFVLGRTGPRVDFDVREEAREGHGERWTWGQVVFAAVMSVAGVVGTLVIWRVRSSQTRQ